MPEKTIVIKAIKARNLTMKGRAFSMYLEDFSIKRLNLENINSLKSKLLDIEREMIELNINNRSYVD